VRFPPVIDCSQFRTLPAHANLRAAAGGRGEDTRFWQYFLIANTVEILPKLTPVSS